MKCVSPVDNHTAGGQVCLLRPTVGHAGVTLRAVRGLPCERRRGLNVSGGVGWAVWWMAAPHGSRGWAQVCRVPQSPTWAPGPFTEKSQSVTGSMELGVGCGCQTALTASWPVAHLHGVLPLCLDLGMAWAGGVLGPRASLFSIHPPNPGLGAPRPYPGRDQPLDNHQLFRSAGHLSAWLGLLPAPEDRCPPTTPGADSFHPDLQGGGAGLRSGFVAKCFLFPPLSKIFICAQCSRGDG